MKKVLLMMTFCCFLFTMAGCSLDNAMGGMDTDNGWMNWKLEGEKVSETRTVEVKAKEYIDVDVDLKEGTLHLVITDEDGTVLYENTTNKDSEKVSLEKDGNVTLSYDTTDAVGVFTLYKY